mgnify:CR=1 FL=1
MALKKQRREIQPEILFFPVLKSTTYFLGTVIFHIHVVTAKFKKIRFITAYNYKTRHAVMFPQVMINFKSLTEKAIIEHLGIITIHSSRTFS